MGDLVQLHLWQMSKETIAQTKAWRSSQSAALSSM